MEDIEIQERDEICRQYYVKLTIEEISKALGIRREDVGDIIYDKYAEWLQNWWKYLNGRNAQLGKQKEIKEKCTEYIRTRRR